MKKKLFYGLLSTILAGFLFTSCQKLPQMEIDAANAAIEETKSVGAEIYLHDNYVVLVDSMNAVMASIEAQNSKFFKNFNADKENLVKVTTMAQEVKQLTLNKKEELKKEILATTSEVKTLIESSRNLILEAPKGKEGTSALVIIKEELNEIEAILNLTNSMLEKEELIAAIDKAKIAKEKATAINEELKTVIEKYKSNVKGRK